jgi:hypothetical protein
MRGTRTLQQQPGRVHATRRLRPLTFMVLSQSRLDPIPFRMAADLQERYIQQLQAARAGGRGDGRLAG